MTIPLATTTIRVLRVSEDPERDPYDPKPAPVVVASGVRAHILTSRGSEVTAGGSQEVVFFRLVCDTVDLHHLDQIEDEPTGEVYEVQWARQRVGLGMNHTQAGLKQVSGVISQPRLTV